MEIIHDNIIWIGVISKLGGVESYAYYMAKKYQDLDIAVVCKSGDVNQLERIREFCPAYELRPSDKVICKKLIINCDTTILDKSEFDECWMVIHADYSQPCYTIYPDWYDERITGFIAITSHIQKIMKEKFNIDCELCYNPLVLEKKEKPIIIVSATRLSKIKRWLANESSC